MSGECYSTRETRQEPKSTRDSVTSSRGMKGDSKPDKNVNLDQLLEYEDMVSTAESKCSQLKGQLERIKQLYANQADLVKQAIDLDPQEKPPTKTRPNVDRILRASATKLRPSKISRQNSEHIGTDRTGAALGTINNILAGITRSIQVPQLLEHIKDIQSANALHGVEDVKINTKNRAMSVISKSKFKSKRTQSKGNSKASSATALKKMKKSSILKIAEIKSKTDTDNPINKRLQAIPLMDKRSKKIVKRKEKMATRIPIMNRIANANKDLVEIYHNKAVKESRSSESDVPKKKILQHIEIEPEPAQKKELVVDLIPPLNISAAREEKFTAQSTSAISRNYEMPTISSRMKQVAKFYMNSFNIKTIPFCPVASTGPSHNIGINIQQVMSMVKTKQPAQHLSPTLAYNIGLAAGRWNDSPLSFLVTSMTSRLYSQCPLSRSTINYQQLQEAAKAVPQETIEEGDETEDNDNVDKCDQSIIITGPSGDVKINNPKHTVWTVEGEERKCTCAPKKGIEFQQIINKFNGSVSKAKMNKSLIPMKGRTPSKTISCEMVSGLQPTSDCLPLQTKEKKLKEVLAKLHDEFEQMTKTYDELSKQAEAGNASDEVTSKLEKLDKELNSKEEEIVMVMTLYKEVLALKQQVKSLKERTYSKENISIRTQSSRLNGYNTNSTAAGLLNKLLRQIQHFQTHYKKN